MQVSCAFRCPSSWSWSATCTPIVKENPLPQAEADPSRYLVAFVKSAATLTLAKPLLAASWEPEAIALGRNAAYLWCADGIIESKLIQAFARATGEEGNHPKLGDGAQVAGRRREGR